MSLRPATPCSTRARGVGGAKPSSVTVLSSPARTNVPAGSRAAAARAAAPSSMGTTSVAPAASAATMVDVANRTSSTTTTFPGRRTVSSSSFLVRTWTLWDRITADAAASGAGFGLELQRLVLEVLLEARSAELAAAARLLVAAEGRLHVERPAVDVDLPGAQAPRDALGARLVFRPHAAGEP